VPKFICWVWVAVMAAWICTLALPVTVTAFTIPGMARAVAAAKNIFFMIYPFCSLLIKVCDFAYNIYLMLFLSHAGKKT